MPQTNKDILKDGWKFEKNVYIFINIFFQNMGEV